VGIIIQAVQITHQVFAIFYKPQISRKSSIVEGLLQQQPVIGIVFSHENS
jgi:hypothetical protein